MSSIYFLTFQFPTFSIFPTFVIYFLINYHYNEYGNISIRVNVIRVNVIRVNVIRVNVIRVNISVLMYKHYINNIRIYNSTFNYLC